jgi:hypothetical protein
LQFDDEVTLLADRFSDDWIAWFNVAEPAFILGNIFVLNALFIKEAAGVGLRKVRVVAVDQHIEMQVAAIFGAHVGIEHFDAHHFSPSVFQSCFVSNRYQAYDKAVFCQYGFYPILFIAPIDSGI